MKNSITSWQISDIILPDYKFQNKIVNSSFSSRYKAYVYDYFSPYLDIKDKVLGLDTVISSENNVLFFPCDSFTTLCFYIETIQQSLYEYCFNNKIKILICFTRETLEIHEYDYVDNLIKQFWYTKGINPEGLQILLNSYLPLTDLHFNKYFIAKDLFLYSTRTYNNTSTTSNDSFKMSLFGGTLLDRPYRVLFYSELISRNLLPNIFYTNIVADSSILRKNILEYFHLFNKDEQLKIYENIDILTQSYTVDKYGLYTNTNIYETGDEFVICPQLYNSTVSIALETRYNETSITEKLYKILKSGALPLWFGHSNIKKYLETLGFKFTDTLDYSFDIYLNPKDRLYSLCDEVERVINLDNKILLDAKYEIYASNINNFNKLTETMDERFFTFNNI